MTPPESEFRLILIQTDDFPRCAFNRINRKRNQAVHKKHEIRDFVYNNLGLHYVLKKFLNDNT